MNDDVLSEEQQEMLEKDKRLVKLVGVAILAITINLIVLICIASVIATSAWSPVTVAVLTYFIMRVYIDVVSKSFFDPKRFIESMKQAIADRKKN